MFCGCCATAQMARHEFLEVEKEKLEKRLDSEQTGADVRIQKLEAKIDELQEKLRESQVSGAAAECPDAI